MIVSFFVGGIKTKKYILVGFLVFAASFVHALPCEDSDLGLNYYWAGYVTVFGIPYSVINYDTCIDLDTVREYYCDGDTLDSVDYDCPDGCVDGACKAKYTYIWVPFYSNVFLLKN